MAAIAVKEDVQFDGSKIYSHVVSYIPTYARPRFIRIQVVTFDYIWKYSQNIYLLI